MNIIGNNNIIIIIIHKSRTQINTGFQTGCWGTVGGGSGMPPRDIACVGSHLGISYKIPLCMKLCSFG